MKNYVTFKHPYVLVEDIKDRYRPLYKDYPKKEPFMNLSSPPLCCPFTNARRSNKTCEKQKPRTKLGQCEICYVQFGDYMTHIKGKEHSEYANNDLNYKLIDDFIEDFEIKRMRYEENVLDSPSDYMEKSIKEFSRDAVQIVDNGTSLLRISINTTDERMEDAMSFTAVLESFYRK